MDYPLSLSYEECLKKIESKPFSSDFDIQLEAAEELYGTYHTHEEIVKLMSELTGEEIDDSFGMFPPFYTDCGRNIHLGKMFLSMQDVNFRIRVAFTSMMGH